MQPGSQNGIVQSGELKKEIDTFRRELSTMLGAIKDISGRINMEATLRKSEKRYRQLLESANSIILRWSIEGTITYVNNFALRYFGYTMEEMIGHNVMMLVPEVESTGRKLNKLTKEITNDPSRFEQLENENIRKNGERVWVNWTNRAIEGDDGKVVEVLAIGNDITERKKAENELSIQNQIHEAVIKNIGTGFVVADTKGNILSLNRAAMRMHDFEDENSKLSKLVEYIQDFELQCPDGSFISPDKWPLALALKGAFFKDYRVKLINKKKNSLKYISYNTVPIYDNCRKLMFIIITMTDYTDLNERNEELWENEQKLEGIFNNVAIGIIEVDKEDRIIAFNQRASDILGYRDDELRGKTIMDITIPDDADITNDMISGLHKGDFSFYDYEKRYRKKDGTPLWVHVTVSAVKNADGEHLNSIGTVEDISEKRKAIAALRESEEKFRLQNEELTRFIYTISHDLKSPLVTIKSFASYLLEDIGKDDRPAQARDINYIQNSVDKMGKLLDELLELSRIGRKEKPKTNIQLVEVIRSAADLVAGRLRERNIDLKITGPPVILYGHSLRFIQLFQNLLDNSAKFMGDQPQPAIEAGSFFDKDKQLVFFVRDNGIGIDPRHHHKIFGLFEKMDNKTEGTGIGLALVKRIVEVHGGAIWFTSGEAEKGTTFYFTLEGSHVTD